MCVHQIKFYKNKYILCYHDLLTSTILLCARHVKIRKLQCNICMNIIKKAFTLIYHCILFAFLFIVQNASFFNIFDRMLKFL